MSRKLVLWCLVLSFLFAGTLFAAPKQNSAAEEIAVALSELDLFHGTDEGFALHELPTRIQGLVMLIRLTGNEEAALAESEGHPFTDIQPWADPYVSFANKQQWIKGYEDGRFGADDVLTEQQYVTLLLRALGYTEEAEDFTWETVEEFAANLGLSAVLGQKDVLDRAGLALISWDALQQPLKEKPETLAESLIKKQVFELEHYTEVKQTITRPEIIPGYLKTEDLQQIAAAYQRNFEEVKRLFTELLRQAKGMPSSKSMQAWVLNQIKEIKAAVAETPTREYCDMVRALWSDFWNEVEGKQKTE